MQSLCDNMKGEKTSTTTKPSVMYGDLMNGACFAGFTPLYLYLWRTTVPDFDGARNICIAFVITVAFSWYSYLRTNSIASCVACLSMCCGIAGMNVYEWPHRGEVIVFPQFLWTLLVISINFPLNVLYKAFLAIVAFLMTSFVLVEMGATTQKLPIVFATLVVYAIFLHRTSTMKEGESLISAQVASLILAGSFAWHAAQEMMSMYVTPNYTTQGGYNVLIAGFFAAAGLAASGSFQQEIEFKLLLEKEVEERTRVIKGQAEHLRVVDHALQASETAVAITDSNQSILWSNQAMERLSCKTKDGLHGSLLVEALKIGEGDRQAWDDVFAVGRNSDRDIIIGGRYFEAEFSAFPSHADDPADGQGELKKQYLVVLKDITERRARERAERDAQRQAVVSKAMVESMQTLSHELRTPLQGIMGMTSLMHSELLKKESKKVPAEIADGLTVVMTSSRLLLTLINNMLDVRKCDSGHMDEFTLSSLDTTTSLTEAIDFCRPFATISDVTVKSNLSELEKSVQFKANPLRFQQVMINLLSNSVKYSPAGSTVTVSARPMLYTDVKKHMIDKALAVGIKACTTKAPLLKDHSPVLVVSVADEGAGIKEEYKHKIFGRFAQLDDKVVTSIGGKATGQPSGTGLGLNLCVEFLDRMNGCIWVSNNPSKGACFSFYLSIDTRSHSIQSLPPQVPSKALDTSKEAAKVAPRFRILYVDDTIINLKVLSRQLRSLGVATVETVDSGAKAMAELDKNHNFNLVITDLQMPEMSGLELTEEIRKLPKNRVPLVVGLTADSSESVAERCLHSGMKHVLHKPITQSGLKEFLVLANSWLAQ